MLPASTSRSIAVCFALFSASLSAMECSAESDFYRDVYPILKSNCVSCHNKTTTEGSLNLESPLTARQGGDSGDGVVAGKASESLIYQAAIHDGGLEMPPKNNKSGAKNLTKDELAVLAAWINEGAKDSVRQQDQIHWRQIPETVHPIYAAAITGDGRWAAAGRGNRLELYDIATLTPAQTLTDPACSKLIPDGEPGAAHNGVLQALAFSSSGEWLASGGERDVKLWKRSPLLQPQRIQPPASDIVASDLSFDGLRFATLTKSGSLTIQDTVTSSVIQTWDNIPVGDKPVISISSDDQLLAIALPDNKINIRSVSGDIQEATIETGTELKSLLWGNRTNVLIAVGPDSTLRIWNFTGGLAAGVPAPQLINDQNPSITALSVIAHSDLVLVSDASGQNRVFNAADATFVNQFQSPVSPAHGMTAANDLFVCSTPEGIIRVINSKDGQVTKDLSTSISMKEALGKVTRELDMKKLNLSYFQAKVTELGGQNASLDVVLGKAKETIEIANGVLPTKEMNYQTALDAEALTLKKIEDLKQQLESLKSQGSPADMLKPVEDQITQAQATAAAEARNTKASLSTLSESRNQIQDAKVEIERATELKDKNLALIASANESIAQTSQEIEAKTGAVTQATAEIAAQRRVPSSICFSADGQLVASIDESGEFRAWSHKTGSPVAQFHTAESFARAVLQSPEAGVFVAIHADGSRTKFDLNTSWTLERTFDESSHPSVFSNRVSAVCFNPAGDILAVGSGSPSRSGDISLWDVQTGELISLWEERHADSVLSLTFSPNGEQLASGSADRLAKITEVGTGNHVALFEGHTHHAMSVSFRADNRFAATGGGDGSVIIWDLASGERQRKIQGWNKEVTAIQYLGASTMIASASGDEMVRIVNDAGGEIRAFRALPNFMHTLAASEDGTILVAGGEDGVLRVWDTATGQELAQFGKK
ncbi:c-type cytochrome domain-containing protein [Planctomicrobium sp. SH668]|uniref:c-type cytochrome domain-containing protein n=1 Tax=Planctomicrobium sp. SH668 TaxID=3448126 RepID=UPI003F5C56FA